ncbi:hypothetical protein PG997_012116 [Apiospora hydei]|uniref:Lytic polysaccharide monooxygenase n=1 Tax=Apiospora hydei TaxID=1337664 RepID=A0ABR1V2E9_9PEZI
MINTKTVVAAGLVAFSNAHMLISNPKPFTSPQLKQNPLSSGQFPCQGTPGGTFSAGANMNNFELGSKQTLQWIGTAVHGGGSCQISISYDTNPTPQSVWKVIHSIEGGCPARNLDDNRSPANAAAIDPDTYDYTIPDNIPAGKATISVSWLNRLGNREFYMYCGAIELTGSGGDKSNYEALPDIYVANVPDVNSCTTPPGKTDWKFPNPGLSVENNLDKYGFPVYSLPGQCGKFSGAAGSGSGSAPGSGSGSGPSKPSASAPASKPSASAPGGVFLTKQPDAAPTQAPTSAPVAPAPSSAPAAPAPGADSGSGSGSSGALTGKCTDGQWNCVGGSSFQQCGSGTWSPVMAMAPGTKCTAGQSTELKVAAVKRVVKMFRA